MVRLTGPVWFIVAVLTIGIAGMGWHIVSLRITNRQKKSMWLGLVFGAGLMVVISLAKGYQPSKAALLFGDLLTGLSIGFVPMRAEMVKAARAEVAGIKPAVEMKPIYIGIFLCLGIYVALFLVEYFVFG
jgi:hypothetical protein